MGRVYKQWPELAQRDQFNYFEDFYCYVTTDVWTSLASDGGSSVAAGDLTGGQVTITTGAVDNNEAAFYTTQKIFLVAANRPLLGEVRLQYAENATNKANVFVGFSDQFGANLMVDDGGGVKTSGNTACIYKIDGGTVWRCTTRNGTAVTDSVSTTTAGGSSFQILRVEIVDMSTTQMTVAFSVDGVPLRDATSGLQINHQLNIASSAQMAFGTYVKAGGAGGEVAVADYAAFAQVRF